MVDNTPLFRVFDEEANITFKKKFKNNHLKKIGKFEIKIKNDQKF